MLLAHSPYAADINTAGGTNALPVLRWALTEKPRANAGSVWCSSSHPNQGLGVSAKVGRAVWTKVDALLTWVSRSPDFERHTQTLWKGEQQDTLQLLLSDLRDAFEGNGLPGLVEHLMGKDPLEKQVLLQKLLHSIGPGGERRQQLIEFIRSTALMEKSTLDFLDNTATAFSALDSIVFDGARLLRSVIHEISEAAQHDEIKATNLARVILSKLHETHFESAIHVLRQGIKSDMRSTRPSTLSVRLLGLMGEKSTFAAVRLGVRVSGDLCQQLTNIGVRGYFSIDDLARVLLISAESGSTELHYLLSRYLGTEAAESVCVHGKALEKFKQAFIALPITLWPPSSLHRRDRLLLNIDRLISESQVSVG